MMPSNIDQLLDEFSSLNRHDRKAILDKLPPELRNALEKKLNQEDAPICLEKDDQRAPQSEFAPWIVSCLRGEKRNDFPALRNNFQMTEKSKLSLRNALGLVDDTDQLTNLPEVVAANDTDAAHPGPSLMNKMGGFLSRKIMSL